MVMKLYVAPESGTGDPADGQNEGSNRGQIVPARRARQTEMQRAVRRGLLGFSLAALIMGGLQAQPALPSQDSGIAKSFLATPHEKPSDASAKRLWRISLVTLSIANVLDVQSSLGKRELNPALAGSTGTLGAQGILLKSAFQGGLMGVEYLLTRSHATGSLTERPRSRLYRTLAIINFADTGVIAGIAAHNYTIPRGHP
jgi:hypothetical protein